MNSEIPWEHEGMGEIGTVPISLVQGGPVIEPPPHWIVPFEDAADPKTGECKMHCYRNFSTGKCE